MKNITFACMAVCIPLLISVEAQAAIYKCINPQAEVYYNDKPCHVTAIEKEMKAFKDPVGGYIPAPFSPTAVAGENIQNPTKKSLVIGGSPTNKDIFSKKEIQAEQSSEKGSNSTSTGNEDNYSPTAGLNSVIIPVVLEGGSNLNTPATNASANNSKMNNQLRVH